MFTCPKIKFVFLNFTASNESMKRVCKKTRKLKRVESIKHLVFDSDQHEVDKLKADALRDFEFIMVGKKEGKVTESFPMDKSLCFNAIKNKSGGFEYADEEVFTKYIKEETKDCKEYFVDTGRVGKKGGSYLQRRDGGGVKDTYINLPPWVSTYFAERVESGAEGVTFTRKTLSSLGLVLARELAQRTGYSVVGVALHPDSRGKLGLHFQYKTCSGGKPLGRSANGKRGRKGLRNLGDNNISLWQFSNLGVDIDFSHKFEGDFDDKALLIKMSDYLSSKLPKADLDKIQTDARIYANAWKEEREVKLQNQMKLSVALKELSEAKKVIKSMGERLQGVHETSKTHKLGVAKKMGLGKVTEGFEEHLPKGISSDIK